MKVKVDVDGEVSEVEVIRQGDRLRITREGQTTELRVVETANHHFVLEYEQATGAAVHVRLLRAAGVADGDRRQLWVNGHYIPYRRVREQRAGAAAASGSLSASIPAVVSQILVSEGEHVAAGDKLLLLESMKMILPVQAPYEGIVSNINCAVGDAVQPGVPLIEMEEIEE